MGGPGIRRGRYHCSRSPPSKFHLDNRTSRLRIEKQRLVLWARIRELPLVLRTWSSRRGSSSRRGWTTAGSVAVSHLAPRAMDDPRVVADGGDHLAIL